jgi:hypothetical protein|tara:strand:- start:368 stop:577 length:210 start_codon:yes stop_codon:yes gene_type:complete
MDKSKAIISNPQLKGQVGESHVWDGPLDTSGFPMGSGSSSGITGMEIKKAPTFYKSGAITQIAKAARGE